MRLTVRHDTVDFSADWKGRRLLVQDGDFGCQNEEEKEESGRPAQPSDRLTDSGPESDATRSRVDVLLVV